MPKPTALAVLCFLFLAACGANAGSEPTLTEASAGTSANISTTVAPQTTIIAPAPSLTPTTSAPSADAKEPSATAAPPTTVSEFARPSWLGTLELPLRPDGHGEVLATPPELTDRRLETVDLLAPPIGSQFASTIAPVPDDVLARSSWTEECPVTVDELAYVTVSHFGFDERFHTGELLVNASVAEEMVEVFAELHRVRFPIEEMRVLRLDEIDAPPTGDSNLTSSFECRPATGGSSWSMHAFGLAIDVNPFHNPYWKGDLVLPELASAYVDRGDVRPGMIIAGDAVVQAFRSMGWPWGGDWRSLKDWMHFSANGR